MKTDIKGLVSLDTQSEWMCWGSGNCNSVGIPLRGAEEAEIVAAATGEEGVEAAVVGDAVF
jgi:hypothetical protein